MKIIVVRKSLELKVHAGSNPVRGTNNKYSIVTDILYETFTAVTVGNN